MSSSQSSVRRSPATAIHQHLRHPSCAAPAACCHLAHLVISELVTSQAVCDANKGMKFVVVDVADPKSVQVRLLANKLLRHVHRACEVQAEHRTPPCTLLCACLLPLCSAL